MTGTQPSKTGVVDSSTPLFNRVDPAVTLPAVLKEAGVHVAMFGKHFHADTIDRAQQAKMFDIFDTGSRQGNPGRVIDDRLKHAPRCSAAARPTPSSMPRRRSPRPGRPTSS